MKLDSHIAYGVGKEDVARMAQLAGMEFVDYDDEACDDDGLSEDIIDTHEFDPRRTQELLAEMASAAFSARDNGFAQYVLIKQAAHLSSGARGARGNRGAHPGL